MKHRSLQANSDHVTPCNATQRQKKPRGEERREEVNQPLHVSIGERATASRLPAAWSLSDADRDFCRQMRPDLNPDAVAEKFRDYWAGVSGAKGRKLDWAATWRNWVRNEGGGAKPGDKPPDTRPAVCCCCGAPGSMKIGAEWFCPSHDQFSERKKAA